MKLNYMERIINLCKIMEVSDINNILKLQIRIFQISC